MKHLGGISVTDVRKRDERGGGRGRRRRFIAPGNDRRDYEVEMEEGKKRRMMKRMREGREGKMMGCQEEV